jgi:hypothetical protein
MSQEEFFELIAKQVRIFCEKYREQKKLWKEDLGGMCAIASYLIFDILKENEYEPTLVHAEINPIGGHCFILCNDYLIDVTATQFGEKEKVIVKKYSELEQKDFWKRNTFINSKKGIQSLVNGWGFQQDPFALDIDSAFVNFEETFDYETV